MKTAADFMKLESESDMISDIEDANEKMRQHEKELRARLIEYKNEKMRQQQEINNTRIVTKKITNSNTEKDIRFRLQCRMRLMLYKVGKYSLEEGEILINYI